MLEILLVAILDIIRCYIINVLIIVQAHIVKNHNEIEVLLKSVLVALYFIHFKVTFECSV